MLHAPVERRRHVLRKAPTRLTGPASGPEGIGRPTTGGVPVAVTRTRDVAAVDTDGGVACTGSRPAGIAGARTGPVGGPGAATIPVGIPGAGAHAPRVAGALSQPSGTAGTAAVPPRHAGAGP